MSQQSKIFIGIRGTVVALDSATGHETWRCDLPGAHFVNVAVVASGLYAATKGELFALDPGTGTILWSNKLPGLGIGLMTIAGAGQVPTAAAVIAAQQDAAAAAAVAAAASAG